MALFIRVCPVTISPNNNEPAEALANGKESGPHGAHPPAAMTCNELGLDVPAMSAGNEPLAGEVKPVVSAPRIPAALFKMFSGLPGPLSCKLTIPVAVMRNRCPGTA